VIAPPLLPLPPLLLPLPPPLLLVAPLLLLPLPPPLLPLPPPLLPLPPPLLPLPPPLLPLPLAPDPDPLLLVAPLLLPVPPSPTAPHSVGEPDEPQPAVPRASARAALTAKHLPIVIDPHATALRTPFEASARLERDTFERNATFQYHWPARGGRPGCPGTPPKLAGPRSSPRKHATLHASGPGMPHALPLRRIGPATYT